MVAGKNMYPSVEQVWFASFEYAYLVSVAHKWMMNYFYAPCNIDVKSIKKKLSKYVLFPRLLHENCLLRREEKHEQRERASIFHRHWVFAIHQTASSNKIQNLSMFFAHIKVIDSNCKPKGIENEKTSMQMNLLWVLKSNAYCRNPFSLVKLGNFLLFTVF